MKKLLILIMFIAIGIAFYEQQKKHPNLYITIAAVIIFMYGMMRLSAKTPSKNQSEEDGI